MNFDHYKMDYSKFRFFYHRMQLKNSYDILKMAYNSRFALYFVDFKSKLFQSYEGMKVYQYSDKEKKSFLTQYYDSDKNTYKSVVYVFDMNYGREIDLILISGKELTQDYLVKIINSIEVKFVREENNIENDVIFNIT